MAAAYKEVQNFVDDLNSTMSKDVLDASGIYTELVGWLGKAEEDYANFAESAENTLSLDIEIAYLDSEQNLGENLENSKNLESYQDARSKLVNAVAESQDIVEDDTEAWANLEKQISSYLLGIEDLADFETPGITELIERELTIQAIK